MNTDTGEIYRGQEQIAAALAAGLPIVPVSEKVARLMTLGRGEERRRQRKADRKAHRKMAKQSRRANRRCLMRYKPTSARPLHKVSAAAVAGALTAILGWAFKRYVGDIPDEVVSAAVVVVMALIAYLVPLGEGEVEPVRTPRGRLTQ